MEFGVKTPSPFPNIDEIISGSSTSSTVQTMTATSTGSGFQYTSPTPGTPAWQTWMNGLGNANVNNPPPLGASAGVLENFLTGLFGGYTGQPSNGTPTTGTNPTGSGSTPAPAAGAPGIGQFVPIAIGGVLVVGLGLIGFALLGGKGGKKGKK